MEGGCDGELGRGGRVRSGACGRGAGAVRRAPAQDARDPAQGRLPAHQRDRGELRPGRSVAGHDAELAQGDRPAQGPADGAAQRDRRPSGRSHELRGRREAHGTSRGGHRSRPLPDLPRRHRAGRPGRDAAWVVPPLPCGRDRGGADPRGRSSGPPGHRAVARRGGAPAYDAALGQAARSRAGVPERGGRGSIRGVSGVTIRPARPADFERLRGVFARAKLGGPSMAGELAFVQGRLGGEAFVADAGGELVGAGAAVAFGVNGWIGGVAVLPGWRGAGLGTALTAAAAHWIAEAGASTASLHATAMGRPVYERLGFAADGRWLRLAVTAGAGPVETARTVAADSSAGVGAGEAGGRDAAMADPLPGMQAGEAIGLGLSAAGPPEEARPAGPGGLDATMEEQPPQERVGELGGLGPPDPPVGVRAGRASDLEVLGYQVTSATTLMRRGPAPAYRPREVFGGFNLFWG